MISALQILGKQYRDLTIKPLLSSIRYRPGADKAVGINELAIAQVPVSAKPGHGLRIGSVGSLTFAGVV